MKSIIWVWRKYSVYSQCTFQALNHYKEGKLYQIIHQITWFPGHCDYKGMNLNTPSLLSSGSLGSWAQGPLEESEDLGVRSSLCLSVCLSCCMPVWACSASVSEGGGMLIHKIWAICSASYLNSTMMSSANGKPWLKWSLDNHSVIVPCVSTCHGGRVSIWAILCAASVTAEKHDGQVE